MSHFEAQHIPRADRLLVALTGECDLRSRDEMTATLLAAVTASDKVIVDLAEVRFLDSSGLHALVTAHHAALARAGTLHVVNATGTVATVLEITGVLELLSDPTQAEDGTATRPVEPS
jgi:anti-sigma B factor antagonist